MSFQAQFPGLFTPEQGALAIDAPKDAPLPATEKQVAYAHQLALKSGAVIPDGLTANRIALSQWIDAHKPPVPTGRFANYPSGKQVAFAERIARLKHRDIPRACFHDKSKMSKWIDNNKPR